ncbi:hypothetical protein PsYK624_118430 [Phanerochaete sordida]|uniref:Uncharacterized protein n=1 Tax=Phanerochaete sordida TaxID=48140 RepID=A0A9P3GIE5_9APHY|nr:hypothetical protein PsYK624_118430 [Phanerochaete sordida]
MDTHSIVLPSELVFPIVSHVVARYIDDLVVGPLSRARRPYKDRALGPPDGGPVKALLCVSYQIRQTTLQVLSKALEIPLVEEGIWRLTEKPFTIIAPVRTRCSQSLHGTGLLAYVTSMHMPSAAPPVLEAYRCVHAITLLDAEAADDEPPGRHAHAVLRLEAALAQAYAACPPAFQDVLFPQLEACRARHHTLTRLVMPFTAAQRAWEQVYFGPRAEVPMRLRILIERLRRIQLNADELQNNWPFSTMCMAATIEPGKARVWTKLLNQLRADRKPGRGWESLAELQALANELRSGFIPKVEPLPLPPDSAP